MQEINFDIEKALEIGIKLEQTTTPDIVKSYYSKMVKACAIYRDIDMFNFFYYNYKYDNINTWANALSLIKVASVLKELYKEICECSNSRLISTTTFDSSKTFNEFLDFLKKRKSTISIEDIKIFNKALEVLRGNVQIEINTNGRTLLDKINRIKN